MATDNMLDQYIKEIEEKLTVLNISLNLSHESGVACFRFETLDEIEHLEQELEELKGLRNEKF